MVAATVLWVISIPSLASLAYTGITQSYNKIGYKTYQHRTDPTIVISEDVFEAIRFGTAFQVGLCFPTIPYVLIMAILATVWFATKD